MRRVLLGSLVLALASLVVPAYADPTRGSVSDGSVSGIDGVLYDDCVEHAYRYSVVLPDGAQDWDLDVHLYGPDGVESDTDRVDTGVLSGTSTFLLCPPADLYGGYTIRATFDWLDADSTWQQSQLDAAHFTMRKPWTRTGLTVSTRRPAYGERVTYRISVWDERPAGYAPTSFAWVALQKRVDGRWVRVKGSRTLTHAFGSVRLRAEYRQHRHRLWVRAVTLDADRWSRSVSVPVRLW